MWQPPEVSKIHRRLATEMAYLGKRFPFFQKVKPRNPVFILGCARSGTSLLTRNLATHTDIATFSTEANDLWHPRSYPWQYSKLETPPFWVEPEKFSEMSLKDLGPKEVEDLNCVFGLFQRLLGKSHFLNKSAMISFFIPFLIDNFPNLRLIHIVRDGRAVSLSYAKMQHARIMNNPEPFQRMGFFYSFDEILFEYSRTWKKHILEVEKQKMKLNLIEKKILYELNYESYCQNPDKHLSEIASFLDINYNKFSRFLNEDIKSKNYKFNEQLSDESMRKITETIEPELLLKGYTV